MLHYMIQVLLFQTLFLAVYDLFLKKETFFQWNRIYLITTSILVYIIPFIKIERANNYIQEKFISLPEVLINPEIVFLNEVNLAKENSNLFTLENFYFLGVVITSLLFLYKINLIFIKIYKNTNIKNKGYNLIILQKQQTAFSFFKYLFLGKTLYENEHEHIIKHELTHIKQKHSIDLLFFELQKIIFWMNPFSYLFQNRIAALHEYIADDKTIKQENKQSFFENLLQQTFQVEKFTFINQFYKKSLIKKRIIMATKNKSKEILKLKYLLVIPLLLSMLIYSSCSSEETVDNTVVNYTELDKKPILKNSQETDEDKKTMELVLKLSELSLENTINHNANNYYEVNFILNKNGDISDVDYSNIPKEYMDTAKKIISSLPEMIAGSVNGKLVKTRMSIVLTTNKEEIEELESISFSTIDKAPIYQGCENAPDKRKCMSDKITKHVSRSFNVDLAQNLDLTPGKKRISVQFNIDKNGNIANVKARAPHPKLQEEAIRIIKLIPKMKAGEQNGKAVNVRYNLPIVLKIEN